MERKTNNLKVLLVNSDFRFGSTGIITANLFDYLQDNGVDARVCYGRFNGRKEKGVYPSVSVFYSKLQHLLCNLYGDPYSFCFSST